MPTTLTEAPIRSAVETAPREALHELQLRRLRTALARREVVERPGALPRTPGKALRLAHR